MVMDAMRSYLELAGGLTEVTRQRAVSTAKALLSAPGEVGITGSVGNVSRGVQSLADDIVSTGKQNRALLLGLVRSEVERVVGGLGLAGREDLQVLEVRLDRLTARVDRMAVGEIDRAATGRSRATGSTARATASTTATTKATKPAAPRRTKPPTRKAATPRAGSAVAAQAPAEAAAAPTEPPAPQARSSEGQP